MKKSINHPVKVILLYLLVLSNQNSLYAQVKFGKQVKINKIIFGQQHPQLLTKGELYNRLVRADTIPFMSKLNILHHYRSNAPQSATCGNIIQPHRNSTSIFSVRRGGSENFNLTEQHLSNTQIPPTTTCETVRQQLSATYNELQVLNQNTALIYPGAIINGNSVPSGALSVCQLPAGVHRQPYNVSAYIPDFNSSSNLFRTINGNYTYGGVATEIIDLMRTHRQSNQPSSLSFDFWEVHSREEATTSLQMRNSASIPPEITNLLTGIPLGVDITNEQRASAGLVHQKNYWIIKMINTYFDVIADPVNQDPRNFFDNPNLIDCRAMFVSSVTFGRIAYVLIETEETKANMTLALNNLINLNYQDANVRSQINARAKAILQSTTSHISGILLGVAGRTNISDVNQLINHISNIPSWGSNSPGMPIAYTLRFLSDGSFVSLDVSTSNTVTYCERIANQYRVELQSLECITQEDDTGDDDIYNRIRVRASNSGQRYNLWSKPSNQAIAMDDDSAIEIDGSRTFTLPVNINNFYFDVSANLRELDVIGTDDSLNGSKRVYLSNIRGGKIININSGNARYKVHFKIIPL